jgi:hypothetical protein
LQFFVGLGCEANVIQTRARWLELLTAVGCMLKEVKAMGSERDDRHATGK